MKYPEKYGRPGNSMTYYFKTVMPYTINIQFINGQRDASNHFLTKRDLGLANYQGITLTYIVAKIYHALLHNCIEPKIKKILRKNQNGFQRNQSMTSQILTIHQILEGVH